MVLGENGYQSGEGRSRTEIGLPGVQQELLEAVYAVNKNIVLVLNNGRPLAFPWAADYVPAIIEAWQLGTQSGNAIAQVVYGDYNPSGKLPMTFPRNVGQLPLYYNYKSTGRPLQEQDPGVVFWSHYSDEKNTPLYPFGYGLSYSKFEYSNLQLNKTSFSENGNIEVSVTLKNNSEITGKEVVQLYIRDLVGSFTRPVQELKDFQMIELKPFETKIITFIINEKTIEFYTVNSKWETEPGDFKVHIGGNSQTTLEADFQYLK
jgi:beta-glucosidase